MKKNQLRIELVKEKKTEIIWVNARIGDDSGWSTWYMIEN